MTRSVQPLGTDAEYRRRYDVWFTGHTHRAMRASRRAVNYKPVKNHRGNDRKNTIVTTVIVSVKCRGFVLSNGLLKVR